ncbi:sit4 phosphatase-associated protein, partial [Cystoisospora suis]
PSSGHDRHHDTSSLYSLLGSVSLPSSSSSHCFHEEEEDFEEEKTSRRRREDLSHTPGRGDSEEEEERPELIGSGGRGGERRRRERRRRTRRNGSEDEEEEERKHGPACGFVLDHIRMNERGRDADDEEEEEDFEETRDGEGMRRNLSTQHHQYTSHLEEEEEQACHTDNPHNKIDHSDIDSKRISAASATLALVLNSDQFMQDLHTNEPPLIRFLCSPVVMYEIVSLLTVVPDAETDSHARKFTSPYYAAEVLCSASPAILSTFLTDPECQGARDLFWSFLRDSQPPVNAVLGGYFSRCWQALIKAHPDETVAYLVSRPNAVEDVAKHLYSRSIADLYKCMLYVDQCIPALIDPEKIIPTLFSLLKHTPETRPYPPPPSRSQRRRKEVEEEDPDREGASSSLSHVVKDERETEEKEGRREEEEETEDLMCGLEGQVCVTLVVRELIYQRLFISYFPTLLRDLTSQPAIQQLIDMITSEV